MKMQRKYSKEKIKEKAYCNKSIFLTAYIQCMPAQEPALLTSCDGVVTSSAGDFVAKPCVS